MDTLTREERYLKAVRELSSARRQMRAAYYSWSDRRIVEEYQLLKQTIGTGNYRALYGEKNFPRILVVQKYRMVANEAQRRRLEVN